MMNSDKYLEFAEDEFEGQYEDWEQWMYLYLLDWASGGETLEF